MQLSMLGADYQYAYGVRLGAEAYAPGSAMGPYAPGQAPTAADVPNTTGMSTSDQIAMYTRLLAQYGPDWIRALKGLPGASTTIIDTVAPPTTKWYEDQTTLIIGGVVVLGAIVLFSTRNKRRK